MSAFATGFEKAAWNLSDARKATGGLKNLVRRGLHFDGTGSKLLTSRQGAPLGPAAIGKMPKTPLMKKMVSEVVPVSTQVKPGTIFAEGPTNKLISGFSPQGMSGKDKEMLNRTVLRHEMSEGTHAKRLKTPEESFHGHKSPKVIIEESNMLATMPEEFDKVKATFKNLRDADNTRSALEGTLKGFEYGKTRMSRHGKKHLERLGREKGNMGPQFSEKDLIEAGYK